MVEKTKKSNNYIQFTLKVVVWLLLYGSFFYFEDFYQQHAMLDKITDALMLFLTCSILFSIGRFSVITVYNRRHAHHKVRSNFVLAINRLTAVLNTTVGIISVMIALGIHPGEFLTSLTIVAMAIAVTFREYITNMISGLIIMFSDQLAIGDRIEVGGHEGRIVDITFSSLVLQDENEDMVTVPNNLVFTSPMVNLSAHRSTLFSVKFELPLDIAVEVDTLEELLYSGFVSHPHLSGDNDLGLKVVEIGKDFVKYRMEMHANSSSSKLHRQLENEVLKEVLKFKRAFGKEK